jgi:hypothetical protein
LSRKRTKAYAKRRRRSAPQLTPEQRVELSLHAMRAYQAVIAKQDRDLAQIRSWMRGESCDYYEPKANEFDQWELHDLQRRNERRIEPLLRLPDSAYEARRLWRYVDSSEVT